MTKLELAGVKGCGKGGARSLSKTSTKFDDCFHLMREDLQVKCRTTNAAVVFYFM